MEYLDKEGLIVLLQQTSQKTKLALNELDTKKLDKQETITTQEINNLF